MIIYIYIIVGSQIFRAVPSVPSKKPQLSPLTTIPPARAQRSQWWRCVSWCPPHPASSNPRTFHEGLNGGKTFFFRGKIPLSCLNYIWIIYEMKWNKLVKLLKPPIGEPGSSPENQNESWWHKGYKKECGSKIYKDIQSSDATRAIRTIDSSN